MQFSIFSIVAGTSRCVTVCPFCVSGELATAQNREVPEINHRNLRKACELAKTSGVQTAMLTSRGEPTLFPDQITEYLETLEPYHFPFIELQTNGIPMARKFETYQPYLQRWYELGLSTILISTVSNRPEINGEVYTPRTKQYIDLPQLIANLHEIGFSVRLTAVCTKACMSTPEQIDEYLQFAKENAVEQVTLRPLNDEYRRETAQAWINEHKMSEEDKENIYNFLNENGHKLLELPNIGNVFDYQGQNVMFSYSLTKYNDHNDGENMRNLIFFPDGQLRYEWEWDGARLL